MTTTTALSTLTSSIAGFDVFIFAALLGGAILFGLSLGRDRIVAMILSTYVATAVAFGAKSLMSLASSLPMDAGYGRILIFAVVFAVTLIQLLRRSLLSAVGSSSRWWQTILLSAFQVGLLMSVTMQLLPAPAIAGLSDLTKTVFLSDVAVTVWFLLPVAGVLLLPNG